ncbi:hypothetical protein CVD25_12885 [Bacillus canaveralius]|uniref:Uncharacterized protein n=1 Tax=Bacillus canaveralius TaxID=1403243 RepID=A0A2N5GNI4_9BACI|nr:MULTISPECIES: YhcN/YlaJ family sporulation lipoprotein [Bacillus]PLR84068.1 hypothetical protein CU635_07120 [Bacillus canaveralius]PLR87301.1 hypothetical protein CVD23_03595 [Bacillus sp. V33-4]PLR96286.1 hypothetical protein CVD25_12885 [Bacillus canaveralius]RSK53528.1 YhcN/YlaJ family sporulation lipoprotein [Bacillus canaveralius]
MRKVILGTVLAAALAGCGAQNEASRDEEQNAVNVRNTTLGEVDQETGQRASTHLEDLANSVPDVEDATAVVIGNYAIVGIDVNENLDRSEVGSIKYSVAESLEDDPYGARAAVVADPDIVARLREIAEDFQAGEPVEGIVNELADLTGRIMPEFPADITDPNPNNTTEDPKKKLQDSESKQLEKEQDDQSYHQKD